MSALARPSATAQQMPLDLEYMAEQAGEVGSDPAQFYLTHGLEDQIDPTRWFSTDWYAWQNPDWSRFAAPYLHYLEVGRNEGRDPSPFVDVTRYRDMTGVEARCVYDLILSGHRSAALGVYETRRDLERCQSDFLNAIQLVAHRTEPPASKRRALVVLQAGRGAMTHHWFDDTARDWDLLVNYYDAAGFQAGLGDYVFFQKGTKFTAMWHLWRSFRHILLKL